MINGQGVGLIALGAAFLVANVFFIGLRVYTKARIVKNFQLNDLGMIIVVLTYASLGALLTLGVLSGIGTHTFSNTAARLEDSLKYIWFLEVIYVILTSIMKASVASTMLQWAKKRLHVILLWTAIVMDFLIGSVVTLYIVFQCKPISYAWQFVDPTVKGKCNPFVIQLYMGIALSAVTIAIDMLFLIVPLFMLKGRGVNKRLTRYIYMIIGVGVLASIANFIRLAALAKLQASKDQLFDAAPVFLWSAVEVSLGICVAGILELGPLLRRYGFKGFESYSAYDHKLSDVDDMEEPLKMSVMMNKI